MKIILSVVLLATTAMLCFAQEQSSTTPIVTPIVVVTTTAPTLEVKAAPAMPVPTDPFLAMRIPLNSKMYIAPF